MNFAFPRTKFLQVLKLKPVSSSHALVRFPLKTFNFPSSSCQQALEAGDNSAGEVHEEVQVQQTATLELDNKREELVKRAQPHERVPPPVNLELKQELHVRGFPLGTVVESCVKRWFKEHLKAAEKGDSDAQVTVGQMICHGYGTPKDVHKGEELIRRAQSKRKSKQSKELHDKKQEENEEFFFM